MFHNNRQNIKTENSTLETNQYKAKATKTPFSNKTNK